MAVERKSELDHPIVGAGLAAAVVVLLLGGLAGWMDGGYDTTSVIRKVERMEH